MRTSGRKVERWSRESLAQPGRVPSPGSKERTGLAPDVQLSGGEPQTEGVRQQDLTLVCLQNLNHPLLGSMMDCKTALKTSQLRKYVALCA